MENFALNHQLMLWLHAGVQPAHWALVFGKFAAVYLGLVFPLVLIYQGVCHRDRRALVIVIMVALLFALVASQVIQYFFPVNRPFVDGLVTSWVYHSPNAAFPSEHMLVTSTVAFGFLFGRVYRVGWVLLVLALIVGWGRIYVGLHYPLDILGGLIIGLISAFICVKGLLGLVQKKLPAMLRR